MWHDNKNNYSVDIIIIIIEGNSVDTVILIIPVVRYIYNNMNE